MMQLCFPFGSERTLPFREISPVLEHQPYLYTGWRQFKFEFMFSPHTRGGTRHKQAFFRQKNKVPCCYCEKLLTYEEATVEHIVQRSKGGPNVRENVTIACGPCNHHRQDYSFDEWKAIVRSALFQQTREGAIHIYPNRYAALYSYLKRKGRLVERRYLR